MSKKSTAYRLSADGSTVDIEFFGKIGASLWEDGLTAKQLAEDLKARGGKVEQIRGTINSPGGSLLEGVGIYEVLRNHPAEVTMEVLGSAFSAATLPLMAGDVRMMTPSSLLMIHGPLWLPDGTPVDARDLRQLSKMVEKTTRQIINIYSERSGLNVSELEEMLADETWMDPDEALAAGLTTGVSERVSIAAEVGPWDVPRDYADKIIVAARRAPPRKTTKRKEPDIMAERLTVEQIEAACPGATSDFVLAQLKDPNATEATAARAWIAKQSEDMAAMRQQLDAKDQQLAASATQLAAAQKANDQQKPKSGAAPVVSLTDDLTAHGDPDDVIAEWERVVLATMRREDLTRHDAVRRVRVENVPLTQAYLRAFNAKTPRRKVTTMLSAAGEDE